jgi:hypothetical protein
MLIRHLDVVRPSDPSANRSSGSAIAGSWSPSSVSKPVAVGCGTATAGSTWVSPDGLFVWARLAAARPRGRGGFLAVFRTMCILNMTAAVVNGPNQGPRGQVRRKHVGCQPSQNQPPSQIVISGL